MYRMRLSGAIWSAILHFYCVCFFGFLVVIFGENIFVFVVVVADN